MSKVLYLAILWHMHQPYYRDLITGENQLPAVRLHGVKDYYPMGTLVQENENVHLTFNFTPSLWLQLEEYNKGMGDTYLNLSIKPASSLSLEDKLFLLKNFFKVNWHTMLERYPRYLSLLEKRGRVYSEKKSELTLKKFKTQDYLDLQVWFNLTWFHPLSQEKDAEIGALFRKGTNFTEEEKQIVIEKQKKILEKIYPLYKELAERGRIEIITSPFYHPMLPLLFNIEIARESQSNISLPLHQFAYPQDAEFQIEQAVNFHQKYFGHIPKGMWPPEGGVSQEIIPLIGKSGVEWIASDEGVLCKSLEREKTSPCPRKFLYQPYKIEKEGISLTIVFRDHLLSDLIAFDYYHLNAAEACQDFIKRLEKIQKESESSSSPPLVTVILDGENCWEYYPSQGREFLSHLYQKLGKHPWLKTTTITEYLELYPASRKLSSLFPGSWVNHNFELWVGHLEKNQAWNLLFKTREFLSARKWEKKGISSQEAEQAWRSLYIAEGSDWCWWYGAEHSLEDKEIFDSFYRRHLINVYRILGEAPPPELSVPLISLLHPPSLPLNFISPVIDGKLTSYYEWQGAAEYTCLLAEGAMHRGERILRKIFYGFDLNYLYLRVDFLEKLEELKDETDLSLIFSFSKPLGKEIALELAAGKEISEAGFWGKVGRIVEIRFAFEFLGAKPQDKIVFTVTLKKKGKEIESYPWYSAIELTVPTEDYERMLWQV